MSIETQSQVDELIQNALDRALKALDSSRPLMDHYPEPNQRHQEAILLVRRAIKESAQ